MLTTSESTEFTTRPGKGRVGVGGDGSDDGGHVDGGGGGGDKSVKKLSKSCQKVVKKVGESSKSPKSFKV